MNKNKLRITSVLRNQNQIDEDSLFDWFRKELKIFKESKKSRLNSKNILFVVSHAFPPNDSPIFGKDKVILSNTKIEFKHNHFFMEEKLIHKKNLIYFINNHVVYINNELIHNILKIERLYLQYAKELFIKDCKQESDHLSIDIDDFYNFINKVPFLKTKLNISNF